ncbi:hypothetical protein JAAARDRAFT_62518 [Jaapia argillacea MUCL 33604]|uniref:Cyclin-like domain-containing protein n=1 Tax=Jaapia argillacea MUCL 33604 TaxID=933084 RepID=A0A067PJV9_9AGAM|nr:hypothetical protein JAAARDRAFT_62518 [Jaapia argillacea MUCL 33604]
MALYTPPSLPHTPSSSYNMHPTLPSMPAEITATWSTWRQPKLELPLTPPSSAPSRRIQKPQQVPSLPPITQFDQAISRMTPLTTPPMDDAPVAGSSRLPPVSSLPRFDDFRQEKPSLPSPVPHLVDWFTSSQKRSAHFIAEKTCEMICYLWFAESNSNRSSNPSPSSTSSPPQYIPQSNPATASLQLVATPAFVSFMQKLLETTQVSQSVIVLSLHYIYRLKERNRFTNGQAGSEFRVAVAALMMANKFVDDNTYTNKTWSEISSISLSEINRMEREFLLGIDFNLYVDKQTYESWLNLLKGLVMAKEKDSRRFNRGRAREVRAVGRSSGQRPNVPSTGYTRRTTSTGRRHRARSTSPSYHPFTFALPPPPSTLPLAAESSQFETPPSNPLPPPGSKRSATTAFSPTSATFSSTSLAPPRPAKRPTNMGLSLEIPDQHSGGHGSGNGASPLESLKGFSKMSLSGCGSTVDDAKFSSGGISKQQTLAAPYHVDPPRQNMAPQNLYYYSLACSPSDDETPNRPRKAKLRYHQAPPPVSNSYYATTELASCPHPQQYSYPVHHSYGNDHGYGTTNGRIPMVVQSASTSPMVDMHTSSAVPPLNLPPPPQVQQYKENDSWRRASMPNTSYRPISPPDQAFRHAAQAKSQSPAHLSMMASSPAPFANAGPPGVQFYAYASPAYSRPAYGILQHRQPSSAPQSHEGTSPDFGHFQWPSERGRRYQ